MFLFDINNIIVYMSHHVYIVMYYYINDLWLTLMCKIDSIICKHPYAETGDIYINIVFS